MLYHLDFCGSCGSDMTLNDLFGIWAEEAEAAIGAKKGGMVAGLWKAVRARHLFAADVKQRLNQI